MAFYRGRVSTELITSGSSSQSMNTCRTGYEVAILPANHPADIMRRLLAA